jgi:8-oxo-dGTP diphosphatase
MNEIARPGRPVAAVLSVVRREDRLLLARRTNPPDQDLWGFPGGRVEWGETLAEAAGRELLEETAVHALPLCLLPPFEIVRPASASDASPVHVILCPVLCRWVEGEGYPADGELTEVAWLRLDDIVALDVGSTSRDVLQLAREALSETSLATGRRIAPS